MFKFKKLSVLCFVFFTILLFSVTKTSADEHATSFGEVSGTLVKREERRTLVSTEYGQISAARVSDNINGSYLLQFFTLEPNALFLPVVLHSDMVFYVQTGSGRLSYTEEDELKHTDIRRGDVYRLLQGSVFFIQSNLETDQTKERQKLRIHAIFPNSEKDIHAPATGPYSSIRDMVLGFDRNVLQAAFRVSEEMMDELLNGTKQPAIIHGVSKTKKKAWDVESQLIRGILGGRNFNMFELNKKKKTESVKLYNIFKEDKDFENCNGWSTAVTRKKLSALKDTNIGLFMVNLTIGSMMGPHWNPMATEIAIVLQGRGMIRVICSSFYNETSCQNKRFEVKEGDVFTVPRFHPMAQMAFNNETLVFMGFSTSTKRNHPQFLAGQASVLRTLDREVLAMAFDVTNTTLDQFLTPQEDSVILGCTSCAEEEFRVMREELEREREAAKEREEAEARKRGEEKAKEEAEARKREEEAAKKEEEARRKREQEEEKRQKREQEEEAARKQEEERQRREQEEEAAAQKQEEERQQREQEEAAAQKQKEQRQQQEKEEADERQRQEQEAAAQKEAEERKQQEQEEASQKEAQEKQRQEQEAEKRQQQEQEEASRREAEQRQQQEQEEAARKEAEERQRQEPQEGERQKEGEGETPGREEEPQGGRSEEEQAAEEERQRQEEARRQEEQERGESGEESEGWF